MSKPEDAGKYQMGNYGPVQGQVIGDHTTVNITHFHGTPNPTIPLPNPGQPYNPAASKQPENPPKGLAKKPVEPNKDTPGRVSPDDGFAMSSSYSKWKQRLEIFIAITVLVILLVLIIQFIPKI